jgi:hypothetical protein
MPALNYRSPQQKSISNDIYQAYLRHYNYDGKQLQGATLVHPPIGTTSYPFIYTLNAPTGWGKTNIGMEPLRFITSAISAEDLNKERWLPMDLATYREALGENADSMNDSETAKHMRSQIALKSMGRVPSPDLDDDGEEMACYFEPSELTLQVRAGMMGYQSEPEGPLPLSIDDGAIAVFVRTRSQTQAFLREARRKELNSVALPSKASVCMNQKVLRPDGELMALDMSIGHSDLYNGQKILDAFYSELDGTNPTKDLTPYNPAIHRNVARLHAHACDSCSKCPLNLSLQTRTMRRLEDGTVDKLEGANAESLLIYRSGIMDSQEYMRKVVLHQQETQDLEESTKLLWEQHPTICPYPVIRNSLPEFDFIILTYPYLFNPSVTAVMSEYLSHVKHVLVDEGHNISQLYSQLTTHVALGGSQANFRMSASLYDFDLVRTVHIEALQKELNKGLFGDKYAHQMESAKRIVSEKWPGYSSEWQRKKAAELLEEDGIFDPLEAAALYESMNGHLKQLGVWMATVQHRYIQWYSGLVAEHGEEQIGKGFEPMPTHILDILFGPQPIKGLLEGEKDEDENDLYYTSLANSPSAVPLRTSALNINVVLSALNAIRELMYSERTTTMRRSQNTHITSIARACDLAGKNTLKACEDIIALAQALIPVFPVEMANWFVQMNVDVRTIDNTFIHYNPFVYDSENTSKYYLNGRIDYTKLSSNLLKLTKDWGAKYEERADYIDHDSEDRRPRFPVDASVQHMISTTEYPVDKTVQDLKVLAEKMWTAYELGTVDQELVNEIHSYGVHFPTHQYENVFPYSDWKIYYRYWDGLFEIIPLTLGRLLGQQFSQYRTVGLISGTFPPTDYIKAFWGLQPYEFVVTEKVGKMEFKHARGASSKFDQRQFAYTKWANLISEKYTERCKPTGKSMIAAFPSKAVTTEVVEHLSRLMPAAHFWPNTATPEDQIDVNGMIDQLNECIDTGIPKVFLVTMGSRFTEGVEYVDDRGNSMLNTAVICGIQYPGQDIHLDNMQKYVVEQFQYTDWQAFELIQTEAAYQKVRQAAGRTIRSHGDEAEVILADDRYSQQFWQTRMPTIESFFI